MTRVDYKVIGDIIRRCCKQVHRQTSNMEFNVEFEKLVEAMEIQNLLPVRVGMKSKQVGPEVIPFISEYYEKTNLSWYTEGKYYTILTFIDVESLDHEARKIIERLNTPQIDVPYDDKVHDIAVLIAQYPCYFALVTSYQNNNPKMSLRPSYTVSCRANKVVIKNANYQYNPKDFS